MRPQLVVTSDLPGDAVRLFIDLQPRRIALAGGSTPAAFYRTLAGTEYAWGETDIFFGDERCVPPTHPESNFRMAHEMLLEHIDARVHRMPGETCDAAAYEARLRSVFGPGVPAFDLVVLGLGEDGHTASLFPGDPALDERERLVVRVERPDHPRLTLTLPVLSAAAVALFLVKGAAKREALRWLLAGADIPAARVHAARTVILADRAAAG
jgi:6-phosphogluconolactonase